MRIAEPAAGPSRFYTLATVVLVVAVLRIAEEVMIPLALALLLAFLLTPVVVRMVRFKLPRTLAITVTLSFALLVVGVVGWNVTSQALGLLEDLPKYEVNLHKKITALKQPSGDGSLSRALGTLDKIWVDLQAPAPVAGAATGTPAKPQTPVPVEVKPSSSSSFEIARDILKGLVKPLGTAGVVIVFVVAILFQREDLRSRFIRVISGGHLNIATQAVDDAAQRVSRYLLAQLLINTGYGICVGVGLYFIGIPHAPLWGLLSALLRFIPFLGPMIATTLPAILAVAVDPGWTMLFWTAGLFLVLELLTNNVVEVLMYGASTGISTLALLAAAVFWTWLWGMPGLFLSTPLTVCLLVIGQYVPGLKFLGVLLGNEPALEPSAQFYQRMLSMDHESMFNAAQAYVEQRSLCEFYDDVFVPALLMSEVDRHNGTLAEVRQKFIFESSRELIEELAVGRALVRDAQDQDSPGPTAPRATPLPVVLGFPARDEADELVALMLRELLRENGVDATVHSGTALPEQLTRERRSIAFISALPPSTLGSASRLCRRLKEANPEVNVMIGVWSSAAKMEDLKRRLSPAQPAEIVTRLSDALVQLKNLCGVPLAEQAQSPEPASVGPITSAMSTITAPEDAIDAIIRELARAFNVPISLVSLIESDREFWQQWRAASTTSPWAEVSVHEEVFASDSLLVVEDVSKDDRFAKSPTLLQRGVRFYAGAPLRLKDGRLVGNLGVLDTQPRKLNDAEHDLLASLAGQLMQTLQPPEPAAIG